MAGKAARYRVSKFEKHTSQAIQGISISTLQSGERFIFTGKIWNFKRFFIYLHFPKKLTVKLAL
jgi:hypothetical protein